MGGGCAFSRLGVYLGLIEADFCLAALSQSARFVMSAMAAQSQFELQDLKRLASLVAHGFPDEDICDALGIDEATLAEAKEEVEFKAAMLEKKQQRLQEEVERVEGWDGVELKAVNTLQEILRHNKNPDFILRTASFANRAQRRPISQRNKPIGDGTIGSVIVLKVSQNFVNGTGPSKVIEHRGERGEIPKKQVSIPTPRIVEKHLLSEITDVDELKKIGHEFDLSKLDGLE